MYQHEPVEREKEIRIISCEQICGQHLRVDNITDDIRLKMQDLSKKYPEHYHLSTKGRFSVIGPNSNDITTTANGKSPWYLIRAIKSPKQQINMLLLGTKGSYRIWGMEISSGLRMKKSTEKYGKEKVADYLKQQIQSIFEEPTKWEDVEIYYHN